MCALNTASLEEIAALPEMTRSRALEVHLWRPYRTWSELENIPGFDAEIVAALRGCGAVLDPAPRAPE